MQRLDAVAELCRRYGLRRLDAFGSAASGNRFDPARSDVDLLVEFAGDIDDVAAYLDFKEALEALRGRPVDLVERQAVEASRNVIRRRRILGEARLIYAA